MKTNLRRTISLLLALMLFLGATIDGMALADRWPDPESAAAMSPAGAQIQAVPTDYGPFKNVTNTLTLDAGHEDLCKRSMTGEILFDWPEPTTYVDVVFIQDFSGSFDGTIADVGTAVKTMVGSLNMGTDIDGTSPKDRVMIVAYQGTQGRARRSSRTNIRYSTDGYAYNIRNSSLATNAATINNWVNSYYNSATTDGGTPTVDGMVEARARYAAATPSSINYNKSSYKVNGFERQRKTVYILITDGAANTAKWSNLPSMARSELNISTYYDPDAYGYQNISYIWSDASQYPDGAIYYNNGYDRTEAYKPMLTAMGVLADGMRTNGGIAGSEASFVSAFWEDLTSSGRLNGTVAGYGQGWDTHMRTPIMDKL